MVETAEVDLNLETKLDIHDYHRDLVVDYDEFTRGEHPDIPKKAELFWSNELAGLAAFRHLPSDPDKRIRVLKAYQAGNSRWFGSPEVIATYEYLIQAVAIRRADESDWRDCFLDDKQMMEVPVDVRQILDKVNLYLDLPAGTSSSRIRHMLDTALAHSLISQAEYDTTWKALENPLALADATSQIDEVKARAIMSNKGDVTEDEEHDYADDDSRLTYDSELEREKRKKQFIKKQGGAGVTKKRARHDRGHTQDYDRPPNDREKTRERDERKPELASILLEEVPPAEMPQRDRKSQEIDEVANIRATLAALRGK